MRSSSDRRDFRKSAIVEDRNTENVRDGFNPKTGAKAGVIEFVPFNGNRSYRAGEIYIGRHGDVKIYDPSKPITEISRETFNKYSDSFEKKEKEVQALVQKFLICGDSLLIHFLGENTYNLLFKDDQDKRPEIFNTASKILISRMELDGYTEAQISSEMLKAEARPNFLRLLDPKSKDFAYGVLKLSWVIRTTTFIFDSVEATAVISPTDAENIYNQSARTGKIEPESTEPYQPPKPSSSVKS